MRFDQFRRRAIAAARDPEKVAAYEQQIEDLAARARDWKARNPARSPRIRVRPPPGHRAEDVVAAVDDALASGFLDVNDAGRDLLAFMVEPYPGANHPTVTMVQKALDYAEVA